jgi:Carboxypeptidase regulatory-like domain/SdrD B-like domain
MLDAGTYRVGFAKTGYVTQYYNNQPTLAAGNTVSVAAGATTSGIGAKMVPAGNISGTVTNNAGTPVALSGVTVTAYNSSGTAVGTATTSGTGMYTISNLTPGTNAYRVGFAKTGYVTQYYNDQSTLAAANTISVTSGSTTSGIGAKMVPTGNIAGTVTNNAATPVGLSGVTVTAYNSSGTAVGTATTSSTGAYTLSNLTPGTNAYRVGFAKTGYVTQYYNNQSTLAAANTITVSSGATTSGIGAALAP